MENITEHDQDVQMFIDGQQGQIIIITLVVEGATGQHLRSKLPFVDYPVHSDVILAFLLSKLNFVIEMKLSVLDESRLFSPLVVGKIQPGDIKSKV